MKPIERGQREQDEWSCEKNKTTYCYEKHYIIIDLQLLQGAQQNASRGSENACYSLLTLKIKSVFEQTYILAPMDKIVIA